MSPFKFAFGSGDSGYILNCGAESCKSRFERKEKLGKGHFGIVWACTDKITGERVACKSITKEKLTCWEEREDVKREVEIMSYLGRHPNIVTLRGAYEDDECVHLAMDCCDGGELFEEISSRGALSEAHAAQVLDGLARAVAHCHAQGVLHRDLKPENILLVHRGDRRLGKRFDVKLADFGLSVRLERGQVTSGVAGSPYYLAPEVLTGYYDHKADIWSMGVILYMMLSETAPFYGEKEEEILASIKVGVCEFAGPIWDQVSAGAKDLISRMLQKDPALRPTADDILKEPWLVMHTKAINPAVIGRSSSSRHTNVETKLQSAQELVPSGLVQQSASLPRVSSGKASQLLMWLSPQLDAAQQARPSQARQPGGNPQSWEATAAEIQELQEGLMAFSLDGEKARGALPDNCTAGSGRCGCEACVVQKGIQEKDKPENYEPTALDAIAWIFGL